MSRPVKPIEITAEAVPTTITQDEFVILWARLIKAGEVARAKVATQEPIALELPPREEEHKVAS